MNFDKIAITEARDDKDLAAIRGLFRAYADWLNIDLAYQGFEEELASLPGKYARPTGALLLAKGSDSQYLGCVGLRPMAKEGACEMKRLYVLPEAQGQRLGARLVERIIHDAQKAGYSEMLLDTLPSMTGAIALYTKAGFEKAEAYYETPISETLFFRKAL